MSAAASPLDQQVLQQASYRARLLATSAGYRPHDREDLQQELLMDCARRSPKFDPSRGEWRGFVGGIMRNHSTVLAARGLRRTAEVLAEDLARGADNDGEAMLDVADRRPRRNLAASVVLKVDVEHVLRDLPAPLRSLALLLDQMSVQEACQRTRKSRSRIYQMIRQIRQAFVRAGYQGSRRPRSGRRG
ncbi:MAG TPA: hypothetical protein VGG72_30000 [Bryobacteraceae bacterium]|jgi:DNA-directed RNA polymerase specialized sigma24 family protein